MLLPIPRWRYALLRYGTGLALLLPILGRERAVGSLETWVVRGWKPEMTGWFQQTGVSLRDVSDLDLEDGFVELLRAFRAHQS